MDPIAFGIVGSGWRAEFFMRIAQACPERFNVAGVVVRDAAKAAAFERRWNRSTFRTLDALLERTAPRFVVSSVTWQANPDVLEALAVRKVPALSETPPAPDIEQMTKLFLTLQRLKAKVQVAEQVHLRPHHAAQLAVAAGGKLGRVTQAQLSVAHGYHGISLMRKFLGIGFEPATIHASEFNSPLVAGAGRNGPPEQEVIKTSNQHFYRFDFGDRLGLLDFTGDQYFAWIRAERLLVRGERGELSGQHLAYLKDFRTPVNLQFVRRTSGIDGDLSGNGLLGIQCGDEWLYRNPFAPASLMDDEVAIASCLLKMDEYIRTGEDFYALADGMQDHYLYILAQRALSSGSAVRSEAQVWAR